MNPPDDSFEWLVHEVRKLFKVSNGELSETEWRSLDELFKEIIPPAPHIPAALWLTVMSRAVPTSIELVLIRDGKVFLTRRDDAYFKGTHFPGSYLAPGETFLQAARRCAEREVKIDVTAAEPFGVAVNHPVHNRFHDCSVLLKCAFESIPQGGEWYDKKPADLLAVQQEYWTQVEPLLSRA
jgi:ADP-ribose pyrophosphatase YjhB (NUDIX family)